MGRNRFVVTASTRIELSDGDWIEVKKELTTGDDKKREAAGLVPTLIDGKVVHATDWEVYEIERNAIWITAWSFRDAKDTPVLLSVDAIRALDTDTFKEISDAINAHVEAIAAAKKPKTPTKS